MLFKEHMKDRETEAVKTRYYLVSDPHGFTSKLKKALEEAGFDKDRGPKKLVILGDLLDRGHEPKEMQEFIRSLMKKDLVIYIRGNHEDLMEAMIDDIIEGQREGNLSVGYHHIHNGTWDTALALSGMEPSEIQRRRGDFCFRVKQSIFWKELMPKAIDYFETEHFVFVHGWIPVFEEDKDGYSGRKVYSYDPDWRNAPEARWKKARWNCGMDFACKHHILEEGKTVVCGHVTASYGHSRYAHRCTESGRDAIFTPFEAEGILAIDGCTVLSGQVNVVVIED